MSDSIKNNKNAEVYKERFSSKEVDEIQQEGKAVFKRNTALNRDIKTRVG